MGEVGIVGAAIPPNADGVIFEGVGKRKREPRWRGGRRRRWTRGGSEQRTMDVREGRRGRGAGSRIVMEGDVRVVGVLDVAPCHRLLVAVGLVGDDVEIDSVHVFGGSDGTFVRLAMEGLQDFCTDG